MEQVIYVRPIARFTNGKRIGKDETYVELIGEGHYAISQTNTFTGKDIQRITLTRDDLETILKEETVS